MTNSTKPTPQLTAVEIDAVSDWVDRYVHAWSTNDSAEIAALFTDDAEYHETPYETDWIGRDEIVAGWQGRWDWQQGGWTFEYEVAEIVGRIAIVTGVGHYVELGDFDNHWTITLDDVGRCSRFVMVNSEQE